MQSKIYDEVVSAIVDRASRVSVGDPMRRGQDSPGPCMGPLVSSTQKERVVGFVTRVSAACKVAFLWMSFSFGPPLRRLSHTRTSLYAKHFVLRTHGQCPQHRHHNKVSHFRPLIDLCDDSERYRASKAAGRYTSNTCDGRHCFLWAISSTVILYWKREHSTVPIPTKPSFVHYQHQCSRHWLCFVIRFHLQAWCCPPTQHRR